MNKISKPAKAKPAKCLSCAPPLHRPDENIENYAHPPERIRTLSDLMDAALNKRSVTFGNAVFGRRPAAFVINWSGITLHRLLNQGIYLYQKPKP